jgi:hypothetical protein
LVCCRLHGLIRGRTLKITISAVFYNVACSLPMDENNRNGQVFGESN